MPVVVTAAKKRPSKDASRRRNASSITAKLGSSGISNPHAMDDTSPNDRWTTEKTTFFLPAEGLEPSSHRWQQILSLPCMPFHHAGGGSFLLWPEKPVKVYHRMEKRELNKMSILL
jgi:hypothetical protein